MGKYNCSNCANRERSDACGKCITVAGLSEPTCWKSKYDNVNRPEHYQTKNGLETIDAIEAFTEDLMGIEAVCTGNVIKYISRWKKKNGIEDLKKAEWYLQRLIRYEEVEESKSKAKETK